MKLKVCFPKIKFLNQKYEEKKNNSILNVNLIPDDSTELDSEATIIVNENDAAHPSTHNNGSTVVIGANEPGASAQSTNSASNSNANKHDGIYHKMSIEL